MGVFFVANPVVGARHTPGNARAECASCKGCRRFVAGGGQDNNERCACFLARWAASRPNQQTRQRLSSLCGLAVDEGTSRYEIYFRGPAWDRARHVHDRKSMLDLDSKFNHAVFVMRMSCGWPFLSCACRAACRATCRATSFVHAGSCFCHVPVVRPVVRPVARPVVRSVVRSVASDRASGIKSKCT